jgi:hypothetical protein
MSIRLPYQDIQGERLLLVALEDAAYGGSDYRHVRATVIRRAVPHTYRDNEPSVVATRNDEPPSTCKGYRVASYVFGKGGSNPTYVDDMQLRGQIDVMAKPLRNGKPYGNEVTFTPHQVCQQTAKAIADFYTKYGKFLAKEPNNSYEMEFAEKLNQLARFLKISKFVFFKNGVRHSGLGEPQNFEEGDIVFAMRQIDRLLAPFRNDGTDGQ